MMDEEGEAGDLKPTLLLFTMATIDLSTNFDLLTFKVKKFSVEQLSLFQFE